MAGAITDIANVTISLTGVTVSRQGYGTPVFLSKHRFTEERVTSYSSLSAVALDFPTTSNAYKAAAGFFSNVPAATAFKVGRIDADLKLTPTTVATGKVYGLTIKSGALSATVSVTATGSDTNLTIATAVAAAIEASAVGPNVVATAATGVVTIVPTGTFNFKVSALKELTDSYTSVVTAPTALQAVVDADADVYFVTAEDHSEAFVLALAADVEARKMEYGVCVAGASNYGSYVKGTAISGDILGKLSDAGYNRTFGLYHQDADVSFPELTYIGVNAPFDAGSVVWTNNVISLVVSKNVDGNVLTGTQQNNLSARNATFIRLEGGQNATRGGLVASGEWIDNIRGRDWLENELKANLTALLLSQKGGKLNYDNGGINQVRSVIAKTLDEGVRRNFINDNYTISLPDERDVTSAKKGAGLLDQGTFKAELSGAILLINLFGTLAVSFN